MQHNVFELNYSKRFNATAAYELIVMPAVNRIQSNVYACSQFTSFSLNEEEDAMCALSIYCHCCNVYNNEDDSITHSFLVL